MCKLLFYLEVKNCVCQRNGATINLDSMLLTDWQQEFVVMVVQAKTIDTLNKHFFYNLLPVFAYTVTTRTSDDANASNCGKKSSGLLAYYTL